MKTLLRRLLLWPALVIAVCLAVIGAFGTLRAIGAFPNISLFDTASESRNTQLINSITRHEQVVLLGLGIQGISERNERSTLFGMDVPGSGRASFIQYGFSAKLGIDGQEVKIEQTADDAFLSSIPKFIFIGHDDVNFKVAAVNNDILSWTTPEIDTVEMINSVLNDETKQQYIDSNEEILRDQAKAFYAGIITSIDSTIVVNFEFRR